MSSTCPSSPESTDKSKFENNNVIKTQCLDMKKMGDSRGSYQAVKSDVVNCKSNDGGVIIGGGTSPTAASSTVKKRKSSTCCHLNNLWSIWYGIFCTALQAYAAIKCLKRILGYSILPWPEGLPYFELNCSLGLNAAAILLLPIFLVVAILKVGNLANDGFKLGRQLSTCSKESPELLKSGGCGLFRYGGPTAPFIHIAISFCLLVPKLLMEAKLIEAGFLSQEWIWHTDLDFVVMHRDRLVVLSFMPPHNATTHPHTFNMGVDKQALPFTSPEVTHTVLKTLKDFIGHENHTAHYGAGNGGGGKPLEAGWHTSMSLEYMNLALALLIYSVRYPALFWSTNKCLGMIFSFQLLINGVHTLISFAGMSILYKVHIAGVWKSLPLLKHNIRNLYSFDGGNTPFLLNSQVTFALYILSTLLVLSSSIVLYFYGHTRFIAFLNQERDRKVITLKGENNSNVWSYFTHCAAFCVLISIGICNAPLLHDYTVIYRGSLDDITLICIIGGILHLFFWIVIWLFLTIKQKWIFKLRITIGRATVREARSLKLVTDVDLAAHRSDDLSHQPLLVVGNGRTYSITETSPKKAIMGVIQKTTMSRRSRNNGSVTAGIITANSSSNSSDGLDDTDSNGEEQIYWLRPAISPAQTSPDGNKYFCWFKKKPHKVTFNETANSTVNRTKTSVRRSMHGINEDDGDYATLRELPLPQSISQRLSNGDDTASEEGKISSVPAPRCLRRVDSGIIPHEELTARSDSVSTESSTSPPEPAGSNHSETSSGVHSNDSTTDHRKDFKSPQQESNYNSTSTLPAEVVDPQSNESTVVIRRKSLRPVVELTPVIKEEPYGRATNMRMTSFTDTNDVMQQSSSATLPHYPTQQPVAAVYPNCSTMPLPHNTNSLPANAVMVNGNSCNVYPRQHTTIPIHHNGVKLITANGTAAGSNPSVAGCTSVNPYIKRLHVKQGEIIRFNEPIYTKINRQSGELYHYTS